jgi:hypothetical protein
MASEFHGQYIHLLANISFFHSHSYTSQTTFSFFHSSQLTAAFPTATVHSSFSHSHSSTKHTRRIGGEDNDGARSTPVAGSPWPRTASRRAAINGACLLGAEEHEGRQQLGHEREAAGCSLTASRQHQDSRSGSWRARKKNGKDQGQT